ncbi:MAG: hypothetical protein M3P30_08590 [Chloroflexota bacterium]|nr:hypothetical protein [Chloroflexota bacterium]
MRLSETACTVRDEIVVATYGCFDFFRRQSAAEEGERTIPDAALIALGIGIGLVVGYFFPRGR